MPDLNRFRTAQDQGSAGFENAIAELKSGRKRSHWIWYVFPQLAGLGRSSMAQHYGLRDVNEAVDYFSDRDLGWRLVIAARTVARQLEKGIALAALMGSQIDAVKLVSSMTLFEGVAMRLGEAHEPSRLLLPVARQILAAAGREGYERCAYTRAALAAGSGSGTSL